jgi:hypothetical protein
MRSEGNGRNELLNSIIIANKSSIFRKHDHYWLLFSRKWHVILSLMSISSMLTQVSCIHTCWAYHHQRHFHTHTHTRTQTQPGRTAPTRLTRFRLFKSDCVCREGIGWRHPITLASFRQFARSAAFPFHIPFPIDDTPIESQTEDVALMSSWRWFVCLSVRVVVIVSDRLSSSGIPLRTLPMTSKRHALSKTDTWQRIFLTLRKGSACHYR